MREISPLNMELLPDGYHWRLYKRVDWRDRYIGEIIVPAGFVTDLGSIPRILWNILPPIGPASLAFVVHDYLYSTQNITRAKADRVLLRAMIVTNTSWAARWLIYVGVRMGGWNAWSEDKQKYGLFNRG